MHLSFVHMHYRLSLSPQKQQHKTCNAQETGRITRVEKKNAALWATILANNSRLGGPDNSH